MQFSFQSQKMTFLKLLYCCLWVVGFFLFVCFCFFSEHVKWSLLYLKFWDRRHQTYGGSQQPAVGMRSETSQQHVCHQASAGRFGVTSTRPAAVQEQNYSVCLLREARDARRKAAPWHPSPHWNQWRISPHASAYCIAECTSTRTQRRCQDSPRRPC